MLAARVLVQPLSSAVLAAAIHAALTAPAAAESTALPGATASPEHVKDGAAELNEQGLTLYAAQDYRHALELFIGAHALENDPNLLFNIGRCYEQLGELDAALEKYQQFIEAPASNAAGVERARAFIDDIAAARRAQAPASPSDDFPFVRLFPAELASVDPGAAPTNGVPWILLGGTAAFAAGGATLYALGTRDHAQITSMPAYGKTDVPAAMTWRRADTLVQAGNAKKLAGGILLGVGGALGITTVILLLSQSGEREAEPPFAVAPAALGGGGGLLFAGSFR